MVDTTYKIIELVGTSTNSWEEAVKNAIETTAKSIDDLRIAEVVQLDQTIEDNKVKIYRARISLSFKYHSEE